MVALRLEDLPGAGTTSFIVIWHDADDAEVSASPGVKLRTGGNTTVRHGGESEWRLKTMLWRTWIG